VANPIASLPKVISPSKVKYVENKWEKVPEYYSNLNNSANGVDIPADGSSTEAKDEDSGSDGDSDFIDSDYEVGDDDDNLFVDNVDLDVIDEGVAKGKSIGKDKKSSVTNLTG
jgi:hypothetical protein